MKILLTRPLADSQFLKEHLIALKFEPIIIPLINIDYLNFDQMILDSNQNILISSKHAFNIANLTKKNLYVIGYENYKRSLNLQVNEIFFLGSDIAAAKTKLTNISKEILYLAGADLTDNLENFLNIKKLVIYKANFCYHNINKVINFLNDNEEKIISFFSYRTALFFLEIIKKYKVIINPQKTKFICFSEKIGSLLKEMNYLNIFWPAQPDIESYLRLMEKLKNDGSK